MKIGIVLYPTFGGSGVVATELGKALANKGHEVHFITYSRPFKLGAFFENIFYHEVRVSDYPLFEYAPYELVLSSKMVDIVRYYKLDLLHVHYAIPHASAAYTAKQILKSQGINIPYITTLHGTDITLVGKDASFEPVITFSINESDGVTAVSSSLKKDTLDHFKIKREIDVIPNFIINQDYNNNFNEKLHQHYAPNGEKLVCHISNFRKVKRIKDVVSVFAKMNEKVPCKLLMVGDGPERHKAEDQCKQFGICDSVLFLGNVKSTKEILGISDLFLLPSETESFGLAALEALASGVPVISSNAGGLPEVNEHNFSGFLSDVGDVSDMAMHGVSLLENEERLSLFKANALKQAEKFNIEAVLPMYERLYERVLNEN